MLGGKEGREANREQISSSKRLHGICGAGAASDGIGVEPPLAKRIFQRW